jgi:hypothetical protein
MYPHNIIRDTPAESSMPQADVAARPVSARDRDPAVAAHQILRSVNRDAHVLVFGDGDQHGASTLPYNRRAVANNL